MMIKYFKDIDILNIELHEGEFGYSEEIADGVIFDISQEGEILSIEVLDVAKKFRKPGCGSRFSRSMWQEHPRRWFKSCPGLCAPARSQPPRQRLRRIRRRRRRERWGLSREVYVSML
ncbi:MAG: DUF2283 domain-containing protein [Euryarchaeota archaeon]|nr:MAG: hypothetical protein C5S47_00765 [ANME-2 cluster archaeon]MEA1863806.1 DUF2283 domain-containing protein [Euryarchaeota archaeon]